MGSIIFNGKDSSQYGLVVEAIPGYEIPKHNYSPSHIPGRSGDLVINEGSYENIERTYQVATADESGLVQFPDIAQRISKWIHPAKGYCRLEDSYEPEYYRMAYFDSSIALPNIVNQMTKATIKFNCMPQRFLKNGEEKVEFVGEHLFYNDTDYEALPLIKLYGSGDCTVIVRSPSSSGSNYYCQIDLTGIQDSIVIDSQMQDIYKDQTTYLNCNGKATLVNDSLPVLVPGDSKVIVANGLGITKVEVTPRWWTL